MHGERRFIILAGNAAIEIGIVFLGDLAARFRPQSRAIANTLGVIAGLLDQVDRHRHMAGLVLDDLLDAPFGRIALGIVHQVQRDAGAACRCVREIGLGHGIASLAVRRPDKGMGAAGMARDDIDLVGHHEGGIEANAKLADQLRTFAGLGSLDALHEGARAGTGNGAERLDHIVAAHADAIVLDDQPVAFGVKRQRDARCRIVVEQFRRADGLVAQLLAGISRVGDQLAQEHILVGIDRVHHEMQQARDIGFEDMIFNGFFGGIAHACLSSA